MRLRELQVVKPRHFQQTNVAGRHKGRAGSKRQAAARRAAEPEPVAEPQPALTVLPDTTAPAVAHEPPAPFTIKVAVRNTNGKQFVMQFRVPLDTLGEINDPKRVIVDGSPHQGFTLRPCEEEDGVKVQYGTASNGMVTIITGLAYLNCDKRERAWGALDARIENGVIKTGGADNDWIQARGEFNMIYRRRGKLAEHALVPAPEPRIASPGPLQPENGNGHAAVNGDIAQLKGKMTRALADVRMLKEEMERRTGLKFRMTSSLAFVLDV